MRAPDSGICLAVGILCLWYGITTIGVFLIFAGILISNDEPNKKE
jgi:hypothetical protein